MRWYIKELEEELTSRYGVTVELDFDKNILKGFNFKSDNSIFNLSFNQLSFKDSCDYDLSYSKITVDDIILLINDEFDNCYKWLKNYIYNFNLIYKDNIRDQKLKELGI